MDPMTNKQALAFAKHELEYYKKVERDGIRMTTSIEFYEIVVAALEKQEPMQPTRTEYGFSKCPNCSKTLGDQGMYCHNYGQKLK